LNRGIHGNESGKEGGQNEELRVRAPSRLIFVVETAAEAE